MHPLIEDCVHSLENALIKKINEKNNEIELKQFMGNLIMDAIASCAFATKIDTHNEPNNEFTKNAKMIFQANWRFFVLIIIKVWVPKLLDKIEFTLYPPSALNFFRSAVSI